ncbi:DNA polymerase III subunit delta [Chloroflexota bacterium]
MLYILSGQDDYSITRSLDKIKNEIGDQTALSASTNTLDGQQLTPDELKTVCETAPFLTGKRLVIVSGLLERFEPRSRPRRQRKTPRPDNNQTSHQAFSDCISSIPDTTILVLIEGRLSSSNPLYKALAGKAKVQSFPLLKEPELRQWVQRRVAEENGSISPRAASLLSRLIGSNLWILDSETIKLVLFTPGRRIEEEDVKMLVGYAQQVSVFSMVDAILESKAELAEQMLQQMLQQGAAPVYLLTMLTRQTRMLVRTRELKKQKIPDKEIQNRLGITAEYALRKTLEQAGRYSLSRLREVYRKLLETDLSIKTGKYNAELALTILVAELCQQGFPLLAQPKSRLY